MPEPRRIDAVCVNGYNEPELICIRRKPFMNKRLVLPGGILWIAGLVMSIIGMNIHTDAGSLVAVIGNILFLVGLGIVGAAWLMARRDNASAKEEEKQEE